MKRIPGRLIPALFCLLIIQTGGFPALGQDPPPFQAGQPLTLKAAIEEAVRRNPGLAQMQDRASALTFIPSQVGTLPDPWLGVKAMNLPVDTFDPSQEGMTQMQVGVSQSIPFPGKLGLRETAARREAEAGAYDVEETRLRLIRDVKRNWWSLFYLDWAIEIVKLNQDLLRQFTEIARTKYTVGQGLQSDVLLAQVEQTGLANQEIHLLGLRRGEEARLSALLNRTTDGPIRLPKQVDTSLPELPSETALMEIAEEKRPLLQSDRRRIDAARTRVDLAEKDFYPDFAFGAAYGFRRENNLPSGRDRPDFFSVGVGMNLPIFTDRKQNQALKQRSAETLQRRNALQDDWTRVQAEVSNALADLRSAGGQARLLKTEIIPQAEQTVEAMRAAYLVNKQDFLNLVRSQIMLYNHETRYWRVVSETMKTLASLSAAVGKEEFDE